MEPESLNMSRVGVTKVQGNENLRMNGTDWLLPVPLKEIDVSHEVYRIHHQCAPISSNPGVHLHPEADRSQKMNTHEEKAFH